MFNWKKISAEHAEKLLNFMRERCENHSFYFRRHGHDNRFKEHQLPDRSLFNVNLKHGDHKIDGHVKTHYTYAHFFGKADMKTDSVVFSLKARRTCQVLNTEGFRPYRETSNETVKFVAEMRF